MPVFALTEEIAFPPPELAEPDGLLAVGGDLSENRLLLAYSMGIFPWYSEGQPILWWSPDPRLVLFPGEFRASRSLRQTIKKGLFTITMDTAFEEVINRCASVHRTKHGCTWITGEMIKAYLNLHRLGHAHSVESWHGDELKGGLYGVALGGAFFGESMFATVSNASKVAFAAFVDKLTEWGFDMIDCQVVTEHLRSFGAREISRRDFLELLRKAVYMPPRWAAGDE
jgi:leucyl/phenylalanyl-tRNA--protein transferase